jgi:hypothetical protein
VKARTFILAGEDSADLKYPTHDFTDGYKVVPFGVSVYDKVEFYQTYKDKHGIDRTFLPNKHRLFVTNRFNRFGGADVPATALQHKVGIKRALEAASPEDFPAILVIETDSGGDSAYHIEKAKHAFGMLFKEEKIAVLVLTGPAPKDSAGNPIEQDWAPLKKRLAGMLIPETVGSDMVSPRQQRDLSIDQRRQKELELYRLAGQSLDAAWTGMRVGGYPMRCIFELPTVRPLPVPPPLSADLFLSFPTPIQRSMQPSNV